MRVLTIFNDYLSSGGERHSVYQLGEAVSGQGITIEVIEFSNHALSRASPYTKLRSTIFDGDAFREIARRIQNFQPDVLFLENSFPRLAQPISRLLSETAIPSVRAVRNYRDTCIAGTHFRAGKPCFDCIEAGNPMPAVTNGCFRKSRVATAGALLANRKSHGNSRFARPSATVFTSKNLAEFHSKNTDLPQESAVIGNPIKFPVLAPIALSQRRWNVGYFGRLEAEKGVSTILDLVEISPHLRFVMAGRGSMEGVVGAAASANPNLDYLGELSHAQVSKAMGDTVVVAVPSRWQEPFGRVAGEAVSNGAVPLVAAVGGLPEVIAPQTAKYCVVTDDSSEGWSSALLRLGQIGPHGLHALLKENADFVRESFAPDVVARRLIDVLERVTQ